MGIENDILEAVERKTIDIDRTNAKIKRQQIAKESNKINSTGDTTVGIWNWREDAVPAIEICYMCM